MPDHTSRPTDGNASLTDCRCGAATARPLGVTEHHVDGCDVFDASRSRRARDLADLAARPHGWQVVRPLSDGEVAEAEDATGCAVPASRRARRRWSVEITRHRVGGRDVLARKFMRDGQVRGVIIDECPETAGAR